MFYPTGPQSPAFGVIINGEGFRPQQSLEEGGRELAALRRSVRGKRGGLLLLVKLKSRLGDILIYVCVCVLSLLNLLFSRAFLWEAKKV